MQSAILSVSSNLSSHVWGTPVTMFIFEWNHNSSELLSSHLIAKTTLTRPIRRSKIPWACIRNLDQKPSGSWERNQSARMIVWSFTLQTFKPLPSSFRHFPIGGNRHRQGPFGPCKQPPWYPGRVLNNITPRRWDVWNATTAWRWIYGRRDNRNSWEACWEIW